jgi:hypothetical protein
MGFVPLGMAWYAELALIGFFILLVYPYLTDLISIPDESTTPFKDEAGR